MDKYNILQSSNEYINFTLKNYINCYDSLDENDLVKLTEVFDLLKSHTMSIGNQLVANKALYGIKLEETLDKEKERNTIELSEQLTTLSSMLNTNDKKDTLFFQSIAHLCDSMQFLKSEELMNLNDLFQDINNHKQSIGNVITDEKIAFFPYDRSKKNLSK